MRCAICGGLMVSKKGDVDETWKGRTITFRGIEARECESCGIKVYEASDIAMMESLIESTIGRTDYPEVMNVEEVSRFLRVTSQTVYNMLRDGRIKATKIGREWRFPKEEIMKIFDLPGPVLAGYGYAPAGADKVKEELEKYRAELDGKVKPDEV